MSNVAGGDYGGAPHLNGESLAIFWVIPFAGILLSIAIFVPLIALDFWHHNFGKVSLFWAISLIIPFILTQGLSITIYELLHVGLLEYVPFIILLLSLFTISGGIGSERSYGLFSNIKYSNDFNRNFIGKLDGNHWVKPLIAVNQS